jgi:GNAT superfamily N-acetyltransferase
MSRSWESSKLPRMEVTEEALATLTVRPIRADDRKRILDARRYTSPQTYSQRFHEAAHHFSDHELTYLTEVDGENHIALVATECDDPDRLVAVARCVRHRDDPGEAELAITVHDPYQHRGIGSAMLRLLCDMAIERGIVRMRAFIERDNAAMIGLMHKVFPEARRADRFGRTWEFVADVVSGPPKPWSGAR